MTAAIPVTTRRFGPSGSWKNANITLEHATAVIARISKELFLKLKCIRVWPHLRLMKSYPGRDIARTRNFGDERPLGVKMRRGAGKPGTSGLAQSGRRRNI